MLCDKCGQREATVHLCEIHRGIPSEMHLCQGCADMFLPHEHSEVAELLEHLPPLDGPRDAIYLEREPEPEPGELEMTAVGQHILVGRLDTGTLKRITDPSARNHSPYWSPDSKLIAHTIYPGEQGICLRVCTPSGRELQRFHSVLFCEPVQWTPDARHVCFSWLSQKDGTASHPVLADVRTGRVTPVFRDRDFLTGAAVLSPDGRQLAVTLQSVGVTVAGGPNSLVVMSSDGSARRQLLHEETRLLVPLSWSPDGKFFVVLICEIRPPDEDDELNLPEFGPSTFCVINVADGRRVFGSDGDYRCCWSPDGKRLLFAVQDEDSISLMTTRVERWLEPVEIGADVCLSAGRLSDALWSPDAKRVAFVAGAQRRCHVTGIDAPLPFENVTCVAWRPNGTELALLVGYEVLLVNPDSPDNSTVAFRISPRDYYDVVGMTWSPDGESLALEVHSAEQTY